MSTTAEFIHASAGTLAFLLVCLFKVVWRWFASPPSYSKPRHQATATLDEANVFRRYGRMERIDVLPRLGRRHATQVLVRSQFVVPSGEVAQERIEGLSVIQRQLLEHTFERPEQPLDAPVLPRAVDITALVANAQPAQTPREHPSGEARLVVGSDELWFVTLRNSQTQVSQQHPTALARNAAHANRQPTAVVHEVGTNDYMAMLEQYPRRVMSYVQDRHVRHAA